MSEGADVTSCGSKLFHVCGPTTGKDQPLRVYDDEEQTQREFNWYRKSTEIGDVGECSNG